MAHSSDDLFDALRKDDADTFNSLLSKHGWQSEWSDYHLLAEAIKFGRQNIANYLLDLNCRVTKPGTLSTHVHVALTYSNWRGIVVKLLNLGASVSTLNPQGYTAVHVAFKNKADEELIDLLLAAYIRECIVNIKDSEELSILHIACSRPNLEIVQALTYHETQAIVTRDDVNAQVKANGTSYARYTPLHFAVKNGHTEIVKFLVKNLNADIYKVETSSSTPLHFALERGDIQMVDCLLTYDKNHTDNVNNMGLSHFMAACAGSNFKIAAEYLRLTQRRPWTSPDSLINNRVGEYGGSPYKGYSALHFAAAYGRLDTVRILLAHGASCFALSAENMTPLVLSIKRGHEDVCRMLWRNYKAYRQSIYDAVIKNNQKCVNSEGKCQAELKNQDFSKPPYFNDQMEMKNQRSTSPLGFNGKKSSSPPRQGLVEKQVCTKPPGFSSQSKLDFRKPPGFPTLA